MRQEVEMVREELGQDRDPLATDRIIRIAMTWSALVVVVLLIWLFWRGVNLAGLVLLLVPLLGAVIAFLRPNSYVALVTSIVLIGVAALLLLIGYTGFLFIPPLVLLMTALRREAKRRKSHPLGS
jgi:uncharacterized membrane protein (UPF0136 family)